MAVPVLPDSTAPRLSCLALPCTPGAACFPGLIIDPLPSPPSAELGVWGRAASLQLERGNQRAMAGGPGRVHRWSVQCQALGSQEVWLAGVRSPDALQQAGTSGRNVVELGNGQPLASVCFSPAPDSSLCFMNGV